MDEKSFFLRLKEIDSTGCVKIRDVRRGVWEKIARANADEREKSEYLEIVDVDRPYLFGLGIAAAVAVAFTSGFLYTGVVGLVRDIAINAPYMELFNTYYKMM